MAFRRDYWKTMGVRLLEGRDFDDHDSGKKIDGRRS